MRLYIVRHAWADEPNSERYPDDALRPLTREGRRRFRRVVKKLVRRGFAPALVATSPLVRCRQTAEIIARRLDGVQIVALAALAPGSNLAELVKWTLAQGLERVAWVGHAPDVGRLAAVLVGGEGAAIGFAKGAAAAIDFERQVEPGQGVLSWLATPELLKC